MIGLLDAAIKESDYPGLWEQMIHIGQDVYKAAAMALKCKILLFAASPLFNDSEPYSTESPQDAVSNLQVWYGGYNADWWEQCYHGHVISFLNS